MVYLTDLQLSSLSHIWVGIISLRKKVRERFDIGHLHAPSLIS